MTLLAATLTWAGLAAVILAIVAAIGWLAEIRAANDALNETDETGADWGGEKSNHNGGDL